MDVEEHRDGAIALGEGEGGGWDQAQRNKAVESEKGRYEVTDDDTGSVAPCACTKHGTRAA